MRPLFALAALALLAGCTQAPPSTGPTVALTPIPGCAGAESSEQYVVVREVAAWRALWEQSCRGSGGQAAPTAPNIDFTANTVVGAFWGPRGGATNLTLGPARLLGSDVLEVEVTRTAPAEGCPQPAVLTWPLALARAPGRHEDVRFRFTDVATPC